MKKIILTLQIIRAIKISMILAVVSAFISSCSKDKTASVITPPPVSTVEKKLVKEQEVVPAGSTITYEYDSQNRVIKLDGPVIMQTMDYQPAKIMITTVHKTYGTITNIREVQLDGNGRATQIINRSKDGVLKNTDFVEYNNDGFMTNYKSVFADGETNESQYTIINGNVTKEMYYENNSLYDQTDYFYDESIPCKIYAAMNTHWGIDNLLGKRHKNEIKGWKIYNNSGALTQTSNIAFTFDANGYIIKRIYSYPLTGKQLEKDYTYQ